MANETPFTCPECGKSFARPQALGAHRSRVHGVAGKSSKSKQRATARANERRPLPAGAQPPAAPELKGTASNGQINRDQLLQTIFPEGMPPREDVLRRATDWLDEAERLSMPVKR